MTWTRENELSDIYSYVNGIFESSEKENFWVTPKDAFIKGKELNPNYMLDSSIYVFPFYLGSLQAVGILSIGIPEKSAEKVFSLEGSIEYKAFSSQPLMGRYGRRGDFRIDRSGKEISFHMIEGLQAICQTLKLIKKVRLKKFIEGFSAKTIAKPSAKTFLSQLLDYPFDQLPNVPDFFNGALANIESNSKRMGYADCKNYKWTEYLQYSYFKKAMLNKASQLLREEFKLVLADYNTSAGKAIHQLFSSDQTTKRTLLKRIDSDPESFIRDGIDPVSLQFCGEFKLLLTSPRSVTALSNFQRQGSSLHKHALTLLEPKPSDVEELILLPKLKEVDALSQFPPGVLPLVASYRGTSNF